MTSTDPLAIERFRTILTDIIGRQIDDHYDGGAYADEDEVTKEVLDQFPDAHFEYRTNEHGVRVRKVVVASEWENDPTPEPLSIGRCTDTACSSAYIPNHAHLPQSGQQAALAAVVDALREAGK
jgi:hypothetical protein